MSRTFLLQDWVTIRGNAASALSVTQDEERWLDLDGFSDAAIWIDIAEVTPPGGASGSWLQLAIETAAVCDEAYFGAMAPPVSVGTAAPFYQAATTPIVTRSLKSALTSNLARYVRWKITPSTTGLWDLTFRIRVVATRSPAFVPTQLSGCVLWLRADLGVTFNGTTVSGWADQSGNGNNASQSAPTSQPGFSANGINGLPALTGNGSSQYMVTNAFTAQTSETLLAVVQPTASPQIGYARILEQQCDHTYYLGVNSAGAKYKLIVDTSTSPYGAAEGGTVAAGAKVIVSATYASPTGTLYVNGSPVAFDTFPQPTPVSQPMYIMQCYVTAFNEYWNGFLAEAVVYNRALSATELTRIHRYLGARYGIAVP